MNETATESANWATRVFGPLLKPVFHPIDAWLQPVYMPWARVCALALFIGAILWVFSLRPQYVNLDAPRKAWYADLRLWTVLSMLPHIFVYLML